MAYDETLASRIRKALARRKGITEKAMFGGLAFLLDGKMFCGIVKGDLMVRVGPEHHEEAVARPDVRPMDFTGRPMRGYVYVAPPGLTDDRALAGWVESGRSYVAGVVRTPGPRPRASARPRAKAPAPRRRA